MKLPKFLKSFVARIAKSLTEVAYMPDDSLIPILTNQVPGLPAAAGADVSAIVAVAQAAAPEASAGPTPALAPTAAESVAIAAVVTKPASGNAFISNLETILGAMGHELPVYWHEAVALAKKAL